MNLRGLRIEKNMTQAEVAALSGVTQSCISQIEKGSIKNPGYKQVMAITKALDCTIDDLLGIEAEMSAFRLQEIDG